MLTFCSSLIHCIGNVQRLRSLLKNDSAQDAQNQPNDVLVSILHAEYLQASCSKVLLKPALPMPTYSKLIGKCCTSIYLSYMHYSARDCLIG